jgi:hypothetical protein
MEQMPESQRLSAHRAAEPQIWIAATSVAGAAFD